MIAAMENPHKTPEPNRKSTTQPDILSATIADPARFVPAGAAFFELGHAPETRDYYFILLPRMTMLAFSSAVEPLRIANQLTGQCLYRWFLLSEDGQPVQCSNSVTIAADSALVNVHRHDAVMVCSGLDGFSAAQPKTLDLLRRHHRSGGLVGGICTGAYTLARAGLLTDRKFTLHWDNQPAFSEHFPDLPVSAHLFESDRKIITCGGGAAGTDMMLAAIEQDHGPGLTHRIADMCVHGVKRQADVDQQSSIAAAIKSRNPRLVRLVRQMHDHIEDPLSLVEMTEREGISKRQMERLFQRYLATSPSHYYKNIRVDHGRNLIVETNLSITEIAFACGFSNQLLFSRAYKSRFGENPSAFAGRN